MRKSILKKIIALSLALIMVFSSVTLLIGCEIAGNNESEGSGGGAGSGEGGSGEGGSGEGGNPEGGSGNGSGGTPPSDENYHDKIMVPEYKEYPRATVSFKDIVYKRPDFDSAVKGFEDIVAVIEANELSFEEQVAAIERLEPIYGNILTMHALSNLYNSKDSSSPIWNEEFEYNSEKYPSFIQKVEDMFVAAANSPNAERFEDEYFGEGLIEEYKDGGKYTDRMVELMETEASLEAEYSSLSTASVEITLNGKTDTVDNHIDYYREKYGETSKEYNTAYTACMQQYEYKVEDICKGVLVELIRTRSLIADELGDKSYIAYAYEAHGRDYTPEQMSKFLDDVSEFVVPVFIELYSFVFYPYFYPYDTSKRINPTEQSLDVLINNGYTYLTALDEELADVYRYMLQFGLYDIEKESTNRQTGAFTTYLNDYEAPYLFMTATGDITDYSTLYHEFGHFADYYVNFNSSTSIDQSEVSSQGLEYIMLPYLEGKLSESDAQYLMYSAMFSALETLLYQGFYARFEELAYALPYEQITEENLNRAVASAAEEFALNTDMVNKISYVFIPHIFLYPFYVQSYCTSIVPSIEIYFMEKEAYGSGLAAYKKLIDRTKETMTFEETVADAGLPSPFASGVLRDIADKIHFAVLGFHYYNDKSNGSGEAA